MIKAIVFGRNLQQAESLYKEWCRATSSFYKPSEALLIGSYKFMLKNKERLRGYYIPVMNDEVKLIGITKKRFQFICTHLFYSI